MKQLMSFFKSPVGKFHASFAAFILFNLLSGLINRLTFVPVLSTVHFWTGLLIVAAPIVYLLLAKNRGMIWKAFTKMVWFSRVDFEKKKVVAILFKITALVIALITLDNAVSGILYKLRVIPQISHQIHLINYTIALFAVPLHVLLGLLLHRKVKK